MRTAILAAVLTAAVATSADAADGKWRGILERSGSQYVLVSYDGTARILVVFDPPLAQKGWVGKPVRLTGERDQRGILVATSITLDKPGTPTPRPGPRPRR